MNLNNHFGETLKRFIYSRAMSQTALAKLLGVTKASITSYIRAKSPHDTTVEKILEALNVSEEEFYKSEKKEESDLEKKVKELEKKLNIAHEQLIKYHEKEIKQLQEVNR